MSWKNDQVTSGETAKILELARGALGVEGDFVELGCYRGDTSLLLAEVLRDYNRGGAVENYVEKSVDVLAKKLGKMVEMMWKRGLVEIIGKGCGYMIHLKGYQRRVRWMSRYWDWLLGVGNWR